MPRFIADIIEGERAVFIEDAHHISATFRMKKGETVTALDGKGSEYDCVLSIVENKRVEAVITGKREIKYEPSVKISVYQGMVKQDKFETILQKCIELGAQSITPVMLYRCEIKPGEDYSKKEARNKKIAREAVKQCGRGIIPEIGRPLALEDVLRKGHECLICPYEEETQTPLKSALTGCAAKDIGIIIGPEGGLERKEAEAVRSAGGEVVTLGPRILRTETAAPAVLAAMMYHFDEWRIKGGGEA